MAVGVVGLVIVGVGRGGHVPLTALALCLLGALSWGIGNVVSRAARVPGGLSLTVWSALVDPVPLLGLSLLIDGPTAVSTALAGFGWPAALSTLYTAGLASLVGYGIFNTLLGTVALECRRAVGAARPRGRDGLRVGDPRSAAHCCRGRRGSAPAGRRPRRAATPRRRAPRSTGRGQPACSLAMTCCSSAGNTTVPHDGQSSWIASRSCSATARSALPLNAATAAMR